MIKMTDNGHRSNRVTSADKKLRSTKIGQGGEMLYGVVRRLIGNDRAKFPSRKASLFTKYRFCVRSIHEL